MDTRRRFLNNGEQFLCTHTEKAQMDLDSDKVLLKPIKFTASDLSHLDNLPADVKTNIRNYVASTQDFEAFKLTEFCVVLKTGPSNFSNINYVHVNKKPSDEKFKCARGSRCDRFSVTVSKKTKALSLCPHEHIVNILRGTQPNKWLQPTPKEASQEDKKSEEDETVKEGKQKISDKTNEWLNQTSQYIFRNFKMDLSVERMRDLEKQILQLQKTGFPTVYNPHLSKCPVCDNEISPPRKHKSVGSSNLLTRDSYDVIHVLVQRCDKCRIVFQPRADWYLNIGDTVIVSLDIMFLLRSLVHGGAPLSTVAITLILDIGLRCKEVELLSTSQVDWLCRLLTMGFYALEALGKCSCSNAIRGKVLKVFSSIESKVVEQLK